MNTGCKLLKSRRSSWSGEDFVVNAFSGSRSPAFRRSSTIARRPAPLIVERKWISAERGHQQECVG